MPVIESTTLPGRRIRCVRCGWITMSSPRACRFCGSDFPEGHHGGIRKTGQLVITFVPLIPRKPAARTPRRALWALLALLPSILAWGCVFGGLR